MKKNVWKRRLLGAVLALVCVVFFGGFITSCDDTLSCAISGDNLRGRITFAQGTTIVPGADLVIQYATSSGFGTYSTQVVDNMQGLISVPYSLCVATDTAIYVRAFQDTNGNNSFTAGEPNGRYDGTENGHATLSSVTIPGASTSGSGGRWGIKHGISFFLDDTGASQ